MDVRNHKCVILQTKTAECALNKETLDLLNEKSVSRASRKNKSTTKIPFKLLFMYIIYTSGVGAAGPVGQSPPLFVSISNIGVGEMLPNSLL